MFFLFVLVAGTGFTSCSDDDENVDSSALIGKWNTKWTEGYMVDAEYPEDNEEWNEAYVGSYIIFNENGTGTNFEAEPFNWKLDGNKLSITFGDEPFSNPATIVKLTSTELVIEFHEKYGTYEYYEKITCEKAE